jgi:hypothetical protein
MSRLQLLLKVLIDTLSILAEDVEILSSSHLQSPKDGPVYTLSFNPMKKGRSYLSLPSKYSG